MSRMCAGRSTISRCADPSRLDTFRRDLTGRPGTGPTYGVGLCSAPREERVDLGRRANPQGLVGTTSLS